jgi:O-methyltransferase involved in polyketide biosynthesis
MDVTLPAFTPVQESLFLTLCGRALDYRSPRPILADTMADEIVRKLDYDCAEFRLSVSPIINIALRAKKLDEVALTLVARHPTRSRLTWGSGWIPGCSASPRRPLSTGTISTSPRSSPLASN